MPKTKSNLLIIEKLNYYTYFLIIFNYYKFSKIYIFDEYQLISKKLKRKKYLLGKKVIYLNDFEEQQITYEANKLTFDEINHLDFFKKSSLYFYLLKVIGSNKLSVFFKKFYLPNFQSKIRFYLFINHIIKINNNQNNDSIKSKFFYFNYSREYYYIKKYLNKNKDLKKIANFDFINYLISFCKSSFYIFLFLPFWLIYNIFKNSIRFKNENKNYKFAQHVINGFFSNNSLSHNPRNDNYIIDNINLIQSRNLFVFSYWKFTKQRRKSYEEYILNKKSNFVDDNSLALFIKIIFSISLNFLIIPILFFKNIRINLPFIKGTIYALQYTYEFENFFSNFKIEYFLARDDMNPRHIIRTIIANKYKCKSIGIMHSGVIYPYVSSYLCYSYFNKYYIPGNEFKKIYSNFWYSDEHIISGHPYNSNIKQYVGNNNLQVKINKFFNNKYKILITLPTINGSSNFDKINILDNYINFDKILDIADNIILIFKCRSKDQEELLIKNLKFNKKYHERIFYVFKDTKFNTHELISNSQILICNDSSSITLEAITNNNIIVIPYLVRFKSKESQLLYNLCDDFLSIDIKQLTKKINSFYHEGPNNTYFNNIRYIKKNLINTDMDLWEDIANLII